MKRRISLLLLTFSALSATAALAGQPAGFNALLKKATPAAAGSVVALAGNGFVRGHVFLPLVDSDTIR